MTHPEPASGAHRERPVALITGAAGDIGRAAARRLARDGFAVVVCDAPRRDAGQVVDHIRHGGAAYAVAARATDETDVHRAVREAVAWRGRIDALINAPGADDGRPWEDTGLDAWEQVLRDTLTKVFLFCRAVTPHMRARRCGKIVNIASSAGRYRSAYMRHAGPAGAGVGSASAHGGILALTRELGFELARDGIYVNAVAVGLIATARTNARWMRLPESVRKDTLAETALGRLGTPDEVAGVISFLASDASSYITATAVDVNGGWWMS